MKQHNIAFYEKTLGQLFCEGARASHKIVRMLLDECEAAGVSLRLNCRVLGVTRGERFVVETSQGVFESETLCVATGGLSIPKMGASGFAFEIAKHFGVSVTPLRPGLVPLTFAETDLAWMRALAGVSADAMVSAGKQAFREAALFTHRGMSGPAILQISSYLTPPNQYFSVDWLPDSGADVLIAAKRARPQALPKTALAQHV
ncbi:MAG TPA: NAD(P)/FAD-dependent oxidoreductase, partial [Terricaulis sp.]|nr:NAD(P)/FAD-dependent oxidoreductase [Terricaulis sp.]